MISLEDFQPIAAHAAYPLVGVTMAEVENPFGTDAHEGEPGEGRITKFRFHRDGEKFGVITRSVHPERDAQQIASSLAADTGEAAVVQYLHHDGESGIVEVTLDENGTAARR